MNLPNMEIPAAVKEIAEQNSKRIQEACVEIKAATDKGTEVLEKAMESSSQAAQALQAQALEALKANIENSFAFFNTILSAKTPADVMEQCSAFTRQQMDLMMAQSKTVQDISAKAAAEAAEPAKDGLKIVMTRAGKVA